MPKRMQKEADKTGGLHKLCFLGRYGHPVYVAFVPMYVGHSLHVVSC